MRRILSNRLQQFMASLDKTNSDVLTEVRKVELEAKRLGIEVDRKPLNQILQEIDAKRPEPEPDV